MVERRDQLSGETLVQRSGRGQVSQRRQQLLCPPLTQPNVVEVPKCHLALVLQPSARDFDPGTGQIGQSCVLPLLKGVAQEFSGSLVLGLPGQGNATSELMDVHALGSHFHHVATSVTEHPEPLLGDSRQLEDGPDASDVAVQGAACRARWIIAPNAVYQLLGRDHVPRVEEQGCEYASLLRRAEVKTPPSENAITGPSN